MANSLMEHRKTADITLPLQGITCRPSVLVGWIKRFPSKRWFRTTFHISSLLQRRPQESVLFRHLRKWSSGGNQMPIPPVCRRHATLLPTPNEPSSCLPYKLFGNFLIDGISPKSHWIFPLGYWTTTEPDLSPCAATSGKSCLLRFDSTLEKRWQSIHSS